MNKLTEALNNLKNEDLTENCLIDRVVEAFQEAIRDDQMLIVSGKSGSVDGGFIWDDIHPSVMTSKNGLDMTLAWTDGEMSDGCFEARVFDYMLFLTSCTILDGIIINPDGISLQLNKSVLQRILEPFVFDIDEQPDNVMVTKAVCYAAKKHSTQARKGSDIPYITHPMSVMQILADMDCEDKNLMIAGVLHDVLEDTHTDINDIKVMFGFDVAMLVNTHTENKKRTWKERNDSAVEESKTASHRAQKLILADRLANLRCTKRDCTELGDKVWERFSQGAEPQRKKYYAALEALSDLANHDDSRIEYAEFRTLCETIFE